MLGLALTRADPATWETASAIWAARLTAEERAALLWAALRSLDPDEAEVVIEGVYRGADRPLPPFLDPMDDARWWADMASPAERRAYCVAAFLTMTRREKHEFLTFAHRRAA